MATITERSPGRWQAKVRRFGSPPVSRTFGSKTQASAWARMIESEVERGVWRDTSIADRATFRECIDRYEIEVTPKKKSATREESHLRILRDTAIAEMSMSRIRSADLAKIRDTWQLCDHSAATIVRRLALVSHIFTTAQKSWGMEFLSNPVRTVEAPQVHNTRTRRVADEEIAAICGECASTEMKTLIQFALATAMRRGEICALHWEHIDFEERVAFLPKTKNGSSRSVPLSSSAVATLLQLRKKSKGPVFALRPDSVTQAFERLVARARAKYVAECRAKRKSSRPTFLADIRFHDLRREATTRLADRLQMHELGAVTGHKDLRMIKRYYHPKASDLAKKLG